jgi:hypothetical protein
MATRCLAALAVAALLVAAHGVDVSARAALRTRQFDEQVGKLRPGGFP